MRSFITLGVVSLVGVAGIFACGDDESTDRPGIGGTGGAGGATGGTGGAAAGTGGATAGTGGAATGGTGGATTTPPPGPLATCTGCVELIVPAVGPNDAATGGATNVADQAIFQFSLATPVDYSNAVVTWRVAAVAPNAGHFVQAFVQNGAPQNYAGAYYTFALDPVAFPANTFRDISIDISALAAAPGDAGVPPVVDAGAVADVDAGDAGAVAGPVPFIAAGFDKSLISAYGLTVGVGATTTGAAVVRVAVDGVTVTGAAGQDHTFNTAVEGFALNTYQAPPGTPAVFLHP